MKKSSHAEFEKLKKQLEVQSAGNRLSEEELDKIVKKLSLEADALREEIAKNKEVVELHNALLKFLHDLIQKKEDQEADIQLNGDLFQYQPESESE